MEVDMSWIPYELSKYNVILSLSDKVTYLHKEPRLLLIHCFDGFYTAGKRG